VVPHADAVSRLLVQFPRCCHKLREVCELGAVDPDVDPVAHDHPILAEGQRLEQVRQRQELPVDADHHLQIEPVRPGLVGPVGPVGPVGNPGRPHGGSRVPGGEVDHRSRAGLPIVGSAADLVDLHLPGCLEPGQDVLGEPDRSAVSEGAVLEQPPLAAVAAAQLVGLVVVQLQCFEQLALGVGSSHATQPAGLRQPVDAVVLAGAVAPRPGDGNLVDGHPRHRERESRDSGLGNRHRPVGRDDRDVPLKSGEVLRDQVVPVIGRHDQLVTGVQQPAYFWTCRATQRRQRERPGLRRGARKPQRDSVPGRADHVEVLGAVPLIGHGHTESQMRVPRGSRVDVELHCDRLAANLDAGDAGSRNKGKSCLRGPLEQVPQRAVEGAERQVALRAEVSLPGGGAVGRKHLVEHRDLALVEGAASAEVRDVLPGDTGSNPVVARSLLQGTEPQRPPLWRGLLGPGAVATPRRWPIQVDLQGKRLVDG